MRKRFTKSKKITTIMKLSFCAKKNKTPPIDETLLSEANDTG